MKWYDFTYMWKLKKQHRQNVNRFRDKEKHWVVTGKQMMELRDTNIQL